MKVGFTRAYAIACLVSLNEDGEEAEDFQAMSNEELESALCLSGYVHDDHMGGVFDSLPSDVQNAEANRLRTGVPIMAV